MAPQRPRVALDDSRLETLNIKNRQVLIVSTLSGLKSRRNQGQSSIDFHRSPNDVASEPLNTDIKQNTQETTVGVGCFMIFKNLMMTCFNYLA